MQNIHFFNMTFTHNPFVLKFQLQRLHNLFSFTCLLVCIVYSPGRAPYLIMIYLQCFATHSTCIPEILPGRGLSWILPFLINFLGAQAWLVKENRYRHSLLHWFLEQFSALRHLTYTIIFTEIKHRIRYSTTP